MKRKRRKKVVNKETRLPFSRVPDRILVVEGLCKRLETRACLEVVFFSKVTNWLLDALFLGVALFLETDTRIRDSLSA